MMFHELPQVQRAALWTLRKRKNSYADIMKRLIDAESIEQQAVAFAYFGYGCPKEIMAETTDILGELISNKSKPYPVRIAAAKAICHHGPKAHKYFEDILKLTTESINGVHIGLSDIALGKDLSFITSDPYSEKLIKDKELFYKSIKLLLQHKRQNVRGAIVKLLENIPKRDFHHVADELMILIKDEESSYHSYHNPIGTIGSALKIFGRLQIEEGIQETFNILQNKSGKHSFKLRMAYNAFTAYGSAAKPYLAKIKKIHSKPDKYWAELLNKIETAKEIVPLISFKEAKMVK